MARFKPQKGFTLIELLIVVAIIAILAMIAVPNFLEAQVRSKVSRVKADMRSLATAIEAYRVDHNTVPPWDSFYDSNQFDQPGPFWISLTTPISYITSLLRDPFVKTTIRAMPGSTSDLLDMWFQVGVGTLGTTNANGMMSEFWCSTSFGPDWTDEASLMSHYPYTDQACPYDPTNGTVSRGDVHRFSGKPPTNFLTDLSHDLVVCQTHFGG